ncbi:rhamnogalacturonan lyase [Mucilaginibacter sp. PAMB04168]|uniref:rhamnogalacturonan lyase n=1 Tax=Mucilaginibacter sp. PAMB04168 TaxID=3138567 RepID=UPI0031F65876
MKIFLNKALKLTLIITVCVTATAFAQRQMEYLNRGLVAVNQGGGSVFLSWRMLGTEPDNVTYNLYHKAGGKPAVKVNAKPLAAATSYTQQKVDSTVANSWFVKAIINGKEEAAGNTYTLNANAPAQAYWNLPLKNPKGYIPNDASVGDLDGDGQYEIILHQTGRGRDNSSAGITDPPVFQAYKLDGTLLWEINLGHNIREGAHYTQFMVYDLDGDGIAELACKTADGTVDGKGKVIGDSTKRYANAQGRILDGPEYFTIFDGRTGAALATTDYIPARGNIGGWGGRGGNGGNDNSGNRVDRFLACVAYLDGMHPSVIMCRGYYGRTVLAAWDWRGGKLTSRWVFDTKDGANPYSGMGNHNLTVADVDADGKDEIVYGSMCVDDNGKGLYTTGLRHGDAVHVSDMDPSRPGLEVFGVHEIEEKTKGAGSAMYDARTGEILWQGDPDMDVGRGMSADIDPRYAGVEQWGGAEGLKTAKGEKIGAAPRTVNFGIWWDGDLLRELLDGNRIMKWDYQNSKIDNLLVADGYQSNNGSKSTPTLSADLFGDWREEVILRAADNQSLRIYTTTIPTQYKFRTLMHDPQYRLSIAWQNVGYNQPPYTSFFLGNGMKAPVKPNIVILKSK